MRPSSRGRSLDDDFGIPVAIYALVSQSTSPQRRSAIEWSCRRSGTLPVRRERDTADFLVPFLRSAIFLAPIGRLSCFSIHSALSVDGAVRKMVGDCAICIFILALLLLHFPGLFDMATAQLPPLDSLSLQDATAPAGEVPSAFPSSTRAVQLPPASSRETTRSPQRNSEPLRSLATLPRSI